MGTTSPSRRTPALRWSCRARWNWIPQFWKLLPDLPAFMGMRFRFPGRRFGQIVGDFWWWRRHMAYLTNAHLPVYLWTCSWDSLHDVVLKVSPISPGSPLASARTVGAFRTRVTRGAWIPWAPSLCVWSLTSNAWYLTGGKWTVRATATEILLSFWLGATGSCIQAEDGPKCQCVVESGEMEIWHQ